MFDTWYNTSMVATFCLLAVHIWVLPRKSYFCQMVSKQKALYVSWFLILNKDNDQLITPTLCCCWMMHRTFSCHQLCCRTSRSRSGQDAARSDFFGSKILRQQNFEAIPKHFSPPSSPQTPVTAGVGGCWTAKLNLKRNPQFLILKYIWNSQRESSIKRIWEQSCQKFQSMFSQIHLVSLLYTFRWAD